MHTHQHASAAVPLAAHAAAERAKVFKLSFEYLYIFSSKVSIFVEKIAELLH